MATSIASSKPAAAYHFSCGGWEWTDLWWPGQVPGGRLVTEGWLRPMFQSAAWDQGPFCVKLMSSYGDDTSWTGPSRVTFQQTHLTTNVSSFHTLNLTKILTKWLLYNGPVVIESM